ncbi:PfaD family polyunsaturated fatty acid/polyketide biosynthesis protein [Streptomyces phyllanthi]|uniref:PfaD family polyunsaturated fatty acid/polyketide biosynthesis protein n=1 Tax=Streptomyces phyllanthi TaxID=1803180 RepID=A0A5N8WBP4_9ACTN|nr:PfaD family polyunsaturated fatty acid/polyketide biosynthesis protein [Streptomyces phyllanthi]MPY43784.1 PfaD family polyunsaturated fatty acid/polyketide biosynthesis protein [Streptomyces phyllanthi]
MSTATRPSHAQASTSAASTREVSTGEAFTSEGITRAAHAARTPVRIVRETATSRLGAAPYDTASGPGDGIETLGVLPPLYPEWLGDRSFCETHGTRFAYVSGEMANGIATTQLVIAMARARMLGFFGAAGLPPARVEQAVDELAAALPGQTNWGVNLIHSPSEPRTEDAVADLLLRRGVPNVSASAFMDLTPAVVRLAASGLRTDRSGQVVRRTRLFAKVSRTEVAEKFMSPAPRPLLDALVADGLLEPAEARLATRVPVAEDVTVEADSGGHTDNRPLVALLPAVLGLRDGLAARFGHGRQVRVGAAGGLGTPASVAAAFALGAAYVMTGSVNQVSAEAGLSDEAKALLTRADTADIAMAPASDMFELGVKVQVLSKGTMFAPRAGRLYEIYQAHASLEEIPPEVRDTLERRVLGCPLDEVWAQTRAFWQERDPRELERAESDPRHRMALVFRWYLGRSSAWAITGEPSRRADYQIWCGPAMGAFNRWAAGSFLAGPARPSAVQIALNLLDGAAAVTRAHQLRSYGVPVPSAAFTVRPRHLA